MKTYQEFVSEAQKCWPGYKKKGTQKLFGKTYNRCVKAEEVEIEEDWSKEYKRSIDCSNPKGFSQKAHCAGRKKRAAGGKTKSTSPFKEMYEIELEEGKVEWDNPKRPLQSGLTPREKNRAKRISTGVEDPDKLPSEKSLERYGKLKIAHDDERDKKVPRNKRHNFKQLDNIEGTLIGTKGELRRKQKDHKNIRQKINSKLYKDDERQKVYHHNDLKEPKESFEYELEESSMGERSRGRATLARGRGADMDRSERTTAAISKKAGLKGTGKFSTKDLKKDARDYTTYDSDDTDDDYGSTEQDHFIRTYSSARRAAKGERLISKMKPSGRRTPTGMTRLKTAPSSESVRRVKDLKKQMTKAGASKTGRVHTVDIMHRDSNVGKGDKDQQMERGRNFIQAVKDTPKHLKKAGAKPGDTVVGKPTAVMPGEDKKTGEAKRAKLYKKIFGNRSSSASNKTGLMVGAVDK